MKIKDFVRISPADLAKKTTEELTKINRTGANLSNRRLSGLIAAGGTVSPAFQGLPKSVRETQRFNADYTASRNRMIAMIQSQQTYLKAAYSTGGDWRKVSAKIEKEYGRTYTRYKYTTDKRVIPAAVADRTNVQAYTRTQIKKFWKVFHKLQEAKPALFVSDYQKIEMVDKISNWFYSQRNDSEANILKDLEKKIDADVRKAEEEQRAEIQAIRSGKHKSF